MSTATLVKEALEGFNGDVNLYRMDPPLEGHEYVIVSAVVLGGDAQAADSFLEMLSPLVGAGEYERANEETFIFGADAEGEVTDWAELPGSIKHTRDHAAALTAAGYEVAS